MNRQTDRLIKELERLLDLGQKLISYGKGNPGDMTGEMIQNFTVWTTQTGEIISRLYPKDNQYHQSFNLFRKTLGMTSLHSNSYELLFEIIGVLEAIKYDLQNGLLEDVRKLLQADIFADFLEMGEHLLKEGYKDAAAVIIGTVLEDTLRKLAETNGIDTINEKGKKLTIDPINIELEKKGIYNGLVKKQITSWADLRNNAAHGHFDQYDKKQVEQMINFVQTFAADYLK